jgi:hypothetical protein
VFIIISICVLFVIILFLRTFIYQNRNVRAKSFSVALQNENNGDYEQALTNYEIALSEVKKTRNNKTLRSTIIEKIKILRTVIQYEKGLFNLHKKTY